MHLDIDIHNYYEHLVVEYLSANKIDTLYEKEFVADVCCLALNKLPARYIRHEVDMSFFLSSSERVEMAAAVEQAVQQSLEFLQSQKAEVIDEPSTAM